MKLLILRSSLPVMALALLASCSGGNDDDVSVDPPDEAAAPGPVAFTVSLASMNVTRTATEEPVAIDPALATSGELTLD